MGHCFDHTYFCIYDDNVIVIDVHAKVLNEGKKLT